MYYIQVCVCVCVCVYVCVYVCVSGKTKKQWWSLILHMGVICYSLKECVCVRVCVCLT